MAVLLEKVNEWVWGPWLILLFIGTGIFLTVRLHFLSWRNLGFALREVVRDMIHPDVGAEGDISPFQSLMTAMAAMMGTGNIVGVAAAMVMGGPGALVWMILSAWIGMAASLTESVLTMNYRQKNSRGEICGGPMYVMDKGLKPRAFGKLMAVLFSVFTLGASIGMGNMTQANSISEALTDSFHIPGPWTGLLLFFLSLLVLLGGISCIGRVCGILVPVMSAAYFLATVLVIASHWCNIPEGLQEMFLMAFSPHAVAGGLGGTVISGMGSAMRFGISRGVFSNEAGLGSAPIAAAAAKTEDGVKQSYITMTGIFFDTIVVCTATGLAIASSGLLGAVDAKGELITGVALTNLVFENALGPAGRFVITMGIVLFAFATIIGWEYYGEKALEYLLGSSKRKNHHSRPMERANDEIRPYGRRVIFLYRLIYCGCTMIGASASLKAVWNFSDIMNGLMAVPNLLCILWMSREAQELLTKSPCKNQRQEAGRHS